MALRKHIVTKEEIAAFNNYRQQKVGIEFTTQQFMTILKELKYATNSLFIKCITSGVNPPIIKVSRGKYVFNPQPVHIDRLKTVWNEYSYTARKSRASNPNKVQVSIDEKRAITLLKQLGYRIYKLTTNYEEI